MKPLDGLFVLDLSRILAGPYCTMTLGDLGARVVKVEAPHRGDDTRGWGPPFWNGESAYFLAVNRNKQSLSLDLRQERGREVLARLLERADVLVENFRPGTLAKWDLAWPALHERYPKLIYCAISGYGLTGPDRDRPGYDLIAQGEGGVMSLTGEPQGAPMKAGVSQADIVAGLWATVGILGALEARRATGAGQQVETSLLEGQWSLLAYHATNWWSGAPPERLGNQHPNLTPYGTYAASDGHLTVGVGSETLWTRFCEALEAPALASREEFKSNSQRVRHRQALDAELAPVFARRTVAEWLERLGKAGVPCGKVRTVAEVLTDPQLVARGGVTRLAHPRIPDYRCIGMPVHFSETPGAVTAPPPLLGEHTQAILEELGYTKQEADEFQQAGIV